MRTIIVVSHGTFAPALVDAAAMLIGPQENVKSASMTDGMGADTYTGNVRKQVKGVEGSDQILLLADLAEGSPMTNAMLVLDENGLLPKTIAFAGMNLPMLVTAAMLEDGLSREEVEQAVLEESHRQLHTMKPQQETGEAEEEI